MKVSNLSEYVLYNKELGLFFGGFDCRYTKYIHKAKVFSSRIYAYDFLCFYKFLVGFSVYSLKELSENVLLNRSSIYA